MKATSSLSRSPLFRPLLEQPRKRLPIARHNNQLFSSSQRYPSISDDSPFEILGIPKTSSYQEVKCRFVELALANHPDHSKDGSSADFIRFRRAFECIKKNHDGCATESGGENSVGWTDEEFQAWFYEEIGHHDVLFRIDLASRKEIIDIANTQSQGGLDRGGMWEMARAMAEQERNLRDKNEFSGSIGIDAGSAMEKPADSRRRRHRR
jgi:DnaJ domain